MNLTTTLIILGLAVIAFVWANWKSRQPREIGEVSMVPYTAVQMIALVAALVMLGHLISLLTGQPFRGRTNY